MYLTKVLIHPSKLNISDCFYFHLSNLCVESNVEVNFIFRINLNLLEMYYTF